MCGTVFGGVRNVNKSPKNVLMHVKTVDRTNINAHLNNICIFVILKYTWKITAATSFVSTGTVHDPKNHGFTSEQIVCTQSAWCGESGIAVLFKPYLASDTNLHTHFDMITVPCYNMDTPELATCNSHINEMWFLIVIYKCRRGEKCTITHGTVYSLQ